VYACTNEKSAKQMALTIEHYYHTGKRKAFTV
jgi:hypothetical protein